MRTNHVDTVIQKLIDRHIDLNQIEIHKTSLLDIMFSNNSDQEGVTFIMVATFLKLNLK